jgi:DNA-binding CsgD family transcriptional regulator
MSDEHAQAFQLTGDIYDAALDPGLWTEVLHQLSDFVGGPASTLISHDVAARTPRFHFIWGDNPEYSRTYEETYGRLNPTIPGLLMVKVGEVWSMDRLMPWDEFNQTRFYKEWVKPQNYGDIVGSLVERSGTVFTMVATSLDEAGSPASDAAKRRMELIVPHVRRAVAIGNVIDMSRIEADTLGDAVDALGAAVFLVRADGELRRANPRGGELVDGGGLLRLVDGRLSTVGERGGCHLGRVIAEASDGDRILGPCSAAVPLADRDGDRYVAYVLPLVAGQRRQAGAATGATAAVFVHKAEMSPVLPLEAVACQFGLSRAELRVLIGMIEIGPPAEVAPVLGLSEATVRTHLRRVFEKTGTSRQADLVKLVAGYANPIAQRPTGFAATSGLHAPNRV